MKDFNETSWKGFFFSVTPGMCKAMQLGIGCLEGGVKFIN